MTPNARRLSEIEAELERMAYAEENLIGRAWLFELTKRTHHLVGQVDSPGTDELLSALMRSMGKL